MGDVDRRVEAAAKAIWKADDEGPLVAEFEDMHGGAKGWYRDLAHAALAAAPSALDRLAAWADEHDALLSIERDRFAVGEEWEVAAILPHPRRYRSAQDADVQVAAERVLARLEEKA